MPKNELWTLDWERHGSVCWWINLNSLLQTEIAQHLLKFTYNFQVVRSGLWVLWKKISLWIIEMLTLPLLSHVPKILSRDLTLALLLMFLERKARQRDISSSIKKAFKSFLPWFQWCLIWLNQSCYSTIVLKCILMTNVWNQKWHFFFLRCITNKVTRICILCETAGPWRDHISTN